MDIIPKLDRIEYQHYAPLGGMAWVALRADDSVIGGAFTHEGAEDIAFMTRMVGFYDPAVLASVKTRLARSV